MPDTRSRAREIVADELLSGADETWRVAPGGTMVRAPEGPDDMVDPRSPELLRWIFGLPLDYRLGVMLALTWSYPRLQQDGAWQAKLAETRRAIGQKRYEAALREAARHQINLADEFRKARETT